MTLEGKVAIVTGGNSGHRQGDRARRWPRPAPTIVIDYVADEAATEELERQIAALGDKAIGDRGRRQQGRRPRAARSTRPSRPSAALDIMVNNAGIETRTSVLDTTEAQYDKVMDINLKSAFFGTQLAAKQMIAQGGGGRIINITLGPRGLADAGQHRRTACPRAACAC